MKLYIGNMPRDISNEDIQNIFKAYGTISSIKIIKDNNTGESKGFGFIEMSDPEAKNAISKLDGKEIKGRKIVVNEARPRTDFSKGNRMNQGRGDRNGGGYNANRNDKRRIF